MPIHTLKKSTFGFYKWAGRKVWIFQSHSTDIRNIGFIIYRDPKKIDRDSYSTELALKLNEFPLSDADADRYNNAKDAEAFDGGLQKLYLQQSERIQSRNVNGKVMTHAITIHCRNVHQGFMVPFLTSYFENTATIGQFVSHTMQNGQDPLHLKAYHNAIILHNQFLSNIRAIPVIGISPKALQQSIQFGEDAPERLIDVLNRCEYFSSIEATSQSGKIGKYLSITTNEKFEAAKTWITQDLPKIWAELDHNFLDKLPTSVQCPRLTTSNLKDASTSRTVAMLNAARVPDNATVVSKWSQPPKIGRNKHPPTTMTVDYTPTDFPDLKKTNHQANTRQTSAKDDQATSPLRKKPTGSNFDNTSTHSNASATSAGTTFTKEDGQSLFTSLTESFLEDMKSQAAQQNKTISDLIASQLQRDKAYSIKQTARRKEEAEARKEDVDVRREQAAQITQLLSLFVNTRVSQVPAPATTVLKTEHTPMDATPASDSPKRSMDTDSDSNQQQHKPNRQKLAK
jgi:hypothetical protein